MTDSQGLACLPSLAALNAWCRASYDSALGMTDARGAVYFIKGRVIKAALDLGMTVPRIVAVERPCKTCKGTGEFRRYDRDDDQMWEGEDCRRCVATGKVTLRFAETRIGDKTFHTPRPRAEFLHLPAEAWETTGTTDWTPEQPGAELSRAEIISRLNELERYFLGGLMIRHGDFTLSNPLRYSLHLDDVHECWACGYRAITRWLFLHDIYRPGLRWKQAICDGCRDRARRLPRQWPANLCHPRHDRGRWFDESSFGAGWEHRVPMPTAVHDGPIAEWLARRGIFPGLPVPGEIAFYPPWGNMMVHLVTIKDGLAYVEPESQSWLAMPEYPFYSRPHLRVPARWLRGWCARELSAGKEFALDENKEKELANLRASNARMVNAMRGVQKALAGELDAEALVRFTHTLIDCTADIEEAGDWLDRRDKQIAKRCAAIADREDGTWPTVVGNEIRREFGL